MLTNLFRALFDLTILRAAPGVGLTRKIAAVEILDLAQRMEIIPYDLDVGPPCARASR